MELSSLTSIYTPPEGLCARVMGILNVTPDSFSDGGKFSDIDAALAQVELMLAQGATIIDVGGESTRPGAKAVSANEELDRVIGVIEAIKARFACFISVDTSKATVMREAVNVGAHMINDVYGLRGEGCLETVAELQVPVCMMHMQGEPRTMQHNPQYDDVINDVSKFFAERIGACIEAGIKSEAISIDPGFGFGKTVEQNYQLLKRLNAFDKFGVPILVGMSRKSMIGAVLNNQVDDRLVGSIACATIAMNKGASIVRVHDVKETVDAVKIVSACM